MNYQASNPESLSETPERLSETKARWFTSSSSKETSSRSANFLHKLEQLDCMTVAKLFNLRWHLQGSEVIPRGGERFTHYQTLYQSLPEVRLLEGRSLYETLYKHPRPRSKILTLILDLDRLTATQIVL